MTETIVRELTIRDLDVDLEAVVPCSLRVDVTNPCENPANWLLLFDVAGSFVACTECKDDAVHCRGLYDLGDVYRLLISVWPL